MNNSLNHTPKTNISIYTHTIPIHIHTYTYIAFGGALQVERIYAYIKHNIQENLPSTFSHSTISLKCNTIAKDKPRTK